MSLQEEITSGEHFGFGCNWYRHFAHIDTGAIAAAGGPIRDWLAARPLVELTVLDTGCGLFSLATHSLEARVIKGCPIPIELQVGCQQ